MSSYPYRAKTRCQQTLPPYTVEIQDRACRIYFLDAFGIENPFCIALLLGQKGVAQVWYFST